MSEKKKPENGLSTPLIHRGQTSFSGSCERIKQLTLLDSSLVGLDASLYFIIRYHAFRVRRGYSTRRCEGTVWHKASAKIGKALAECNHWRIGKICVQSRYSHRSKRCMIEWFKQRRDACVQSSICLLYTSILYWAYQLHLGKRPDIPMFQVCATDFNQLDGNVYQRVFFQIRANEPYSFYHRYSGQYLQHWRWVLHDTVELLSDVCVCLPIMLAFVRLVPGSVLILQ